jgi:hypothetical protein
VLSSSSRHTVLEEEQLVVGRAVEAGSHAAAVAGRRSWGLAGAKQVWWHLWLAATQSQST